MLYYIRTKFSKSLSAYKSFMLILIVMSRCPPNAFLTFGIILSFRYVQKKVIIRTTESSHQLQLLGEPARTSCKNSGQIKMLAHSENSSTYKVDSTGVAQMLRIIRRAHTFIMSSCFGHALQCTDDAVHQRRIGWPDVFFMLVATFNCLFPHMSPTTSNVRPTLVLVYSD